jgi:hypothetical protein
LGAGELKIVDDGQQAGHDVAADAHCQLVLLVTLSPKAGGKWIGSLGLGKWLRKVTSRTQGR